MKSGSSRGGFAVVLVAFAVFAAAVIGTLVVKGFRDGSSLYPERAYPYQGRLIIGTNEVHEPKW